VPDYPIDRRWQRRHGRVRKQREGIGQDRSALVPDAVDEALATSVGDRADHVAGAAGDRDGDVSPSLAAERAIVAVGVDLDVPVCQQRAVASNEHGVTSVGIEGEDGEAPAAALPVRGDRPSSHAPRGHAARLAKMGGRDEEILTSMYSARPTKAPLVGGTLTATVFPPTPWLNPFSAATATAALRAALAFAAT
jgi:hypothetical protein